MALRAQADEVAVGIDQVWPLVRVLDMMHHHRRRLLPVPLAPLAQIPVPPQDCRALPLPSSAVVKVHGITYKKAAPREQDSLNFRAPFDAPLMVTVSNRAGMLCALSPNHGITLVHPSRAFCICACGSRTCRVRPNGRMWRKFFTSSV